MSILEMLCFLKRRRKGEFVKTISVRLPEQTYAELVRRADLTGIAPAVLARAWLKEAIEGGANGFSSLQRSAEKGTELHRESSSGSNRRGSRGGKKRKGR